MRALDRLAGSRHAVRGATSAAGLLLICCVLAPLLIGVAGALAIGIEVAAIASTATAVALVVHRRRVCGGDSDPSYELENKGG